MSKNQARSILFVPMLGMATAILWVYTYLFTGVILIGGPAIYILAAAFLLVTAVLVPLAAAKLEL